MRYKIMPADALEDTSRRLDGCVALLAALTDSAGVGSVVSDGALSAVTDLMKAVCDDLQTNISAAEDYPEGGHGGVVK